MKKKLVIFLGVVILASALILGYLIFSKKFISQPKTSTSTPEQAKKIITPKYKLWDEELNEGLRFDKEMKSVVIGKIGFKRDYTSPEYDGKKIYMPFDGTVKALKIPAFDVFGDKFYVGLTLKKTGENKRLYIW